MTHTELQRDGLELTLALAQGEEMYVSKLQELIGKGYSLHDVVLAVGFAGLLLSEEVANELNTTPVELLKILVSMMGEQQPT